MKSLCIFIHYSPENFVPLYIQLYLQELQRHFSDVLLVTNDRPLQNAEVIARFETLKVTNEGYDLGMFYKGFQHKNGWEYEQVACINDSNILLGPLDTIFDWASQQSADFWGVYGVNLRPVFSTHQDNYHIQSHFIVFNSNAVKVLPAFFDLIDIQAIFSMTEVKELKRRVINDWEIGITQYLLSQGLLSASYISFDDIYKETGVKAGTNLSVKYHDELLKRGVPLLKKQIVFATIPRHNLAIRRHWRRMIRVYGHPEWPLARLVTELTQMRWRHLWRKVSK